MFMAVDVLKERVYERYSLTLTDRQWDLVKHHHGKTDGRIDLVALMKQIFACDSMEEELPVGYLSKQSKFDTGGREVGKRQLPAGLLDTGVTYGPS